MADYYTLLTDAGIAYETACKAAGTPIKLSQISVGDGGGTEYNPAATATALKREVWRGPLNALFQDENNPSWLLAEVTIPSDVGGWYVREAGIWTDTGILYAIVKYPESFKPVLATSGSGKEFYIRSIFETSNAELVTLLIDDTVVKATRAWVAGYVADELAKLDRKQSVRVATTVNIVLSGAQAIDGVAVIAGNRVLVKSQTLAKDNGIYVAANGAWIRAKDADASVEVTSGLIVSVEEGVTLANTIWQLVTDGAIVLGTTALTFQNVTQGFAAINSPAFLGAPTAPTLAGTDVSTKIANAATVRAIMARFGLGSSGYNYAGDIDALVENGVFMVSTSTTGTKPEYPSAQGTGQIPQGSVFHMERGSSNMATQFWDSLVNAIEPITCMRTRNANGVWSKWEQITTVERVRSVLDTYGLGVDSGKIPLITDFSMDIKPGLYRAYTDGHSSAAIGAPTDTGNTTMSVIVGSSLNRGYKTFIAVINTSFSGAFRVFVGAKVTADAQPVWGEIAQSFHLPYRAKVLYKIAGVYQWTVPAGVTKVHVEVVGGGGSGAFIGDGSTTVGPGGGGGGGISNRLCTVVPGGVITVTVGAGGAAVTGDGDPGIAGGTSSFGSFCSATGGRGGVMNAGALGGAGSGGDFNASLGLGFPPVRNVAGTGPWGGQGGGGESAFAALDTSNLTRPGMGGGGRTKTRSQPGADGCVFITY